MEQVKQIKTEEKSLSNLNLKVIDLNVENAEDDFYFLKDDLTELLKEKLLKNNISVINDLKVFYSLSNCQGDGFMFEGLIQTKKARFRIKQSGFYYHENSKKIFLDCLFIGNKEVYPTEMTEKQEEKANKIEDEFNYLYIDICKELEKEGYSIIEAINKENILRSGFNDWKEENNINSNLEIYDFNYKEEETKDYIKICNSGNTSFKGLWIKNQKIKISDFIKAEITEYQEKVLI